MYQNEISTRTQINKKQKIYLSKRETAPATTGDATLVPDNERHPPLIKVQKENTFQLSQMAATGRGTNFLI